MRRDYGDKTLKFEVRRIDDLVEKIIPHFEQYPLHSAKYEDFLLFAKISRMIKDKKHLNSKGAKEIIELSFQMNGSGKRKYSKEEMISRINQVKI